MALLVLFIGYLRPGELFKLTLASLVAPQSGVGGSPHWSLVLGDQTVGGAPCKTGEFNESVTLDWGLEWASPLFRLLSGRPLTGPLWTFDAPHLTTVMLQAATVSGVSVLAPQLFALRHGGASHDALSHRRSLQDIKNRGRWRTDASVRRYLKSAMALRELSRLSNATLDYAARVEKSLAAVMLGEMVPPVPPMAGLLLST